MKTLELCMSKGFGGLELYVLKVTQFLHNNNKDFCVFTKENSFLFNKLDENNIQSDSLSSVFYHFPLISAIKLARYINKNKVDVVHVHWGKDLFFAVLAKVFSSREIKLVYTRQMALTRKKNDFYHRFLYKNLNLYLVITKELYRDAIKYLPILKDRVQLLYYGVPEAQVDKVECKKYISDSGMNSNIFRIAIFGRVEKGKGQHLVVDAVKKLIAKGKSVQLAIIGHVMDQTYLDQLETEIKDNNLENNVFMLGFHNTPTHIMPCFDAVVLATKCETFGLVLPEAMRAGVAVLGSNCGGVPEIITHEKTGLLFEAENANDLTNQLLTIIDDKAYCEKLARAGKSDADERFSEEKHFKKLTQYFESR